MYYKCPECEQVLDDRKFPENGPCPYCAPDELPGDKSYRGKRARRLPGVTRDAIQKGAEKREAARQQRHTASVVNYAWAVIALVALGVLLPFATPKIYLQMVEHEYAVTSYINQFVPQLNALATSLIADDNLWPAASSAAAAAAPGGILTYTHGRLAGGATLCMWMAIVTGLLGGGCVAMLYLKAIQWPDFRSRAHTLCMAVLVAVLGLNFVGARTIAGARSFDYATNAGAIESMLGMLVYAELRDNNGAAALAHLYKGAPRDFEDGRGAGYLHIASEFGARDIIETLIQWGIDVNATDTTGMTPLHYAAGKGRVFAAEMLIQHGANLAQVDARGQGMLHYAAEKKNTAILEDLIDRGLDVNLADQEGRTPLIVAAESGNAEAITLLLAAGANLEERDPEGHTLFQVTLMHVLEGMYREAPAISGNEDPRLRVMRVLLERGADVNAVDAVSQTPLHWVRDARNRVEDETELSVFLDGLMTLLFEHGADFTREDLAGRPAYTIHDAARMGHLSVAQHLLEGDPDAVSSLDRRGRTALEIAVSGGQVEVARALLEHGADPNQWRNLGESALTFAIDRGNAEIVSLLLAHGVKAEANAHGQDNPLIRGAQRGSAEIVALLLDHGCPVNTRNVHGDTPLHAAAAGGHEAVVKLLLERGADTTAWNRSGKTPLDVAESSERKKVASILRRMPLPVAPASNR